MIGKSFLNQFHCGFPSGSALVAGLQIMEGLAERRDWPSWAWSAW